MLRICSTCDRHVRALAACPYCGSDVRHTSKPSPVLRAPRVAAAMAAVAAIGLGACSVSLAPSYGLADSPPDPRDAGQGAKSEAGPTLLPKNPGVDASEPERDADADVDADAGADAGDAADAGSD